LVRSDDADGDDGRGRQPRLRAQPAVDLREQPVPEPIEAVAGSAGARVTERIRFGT
jgi:hypothetical protein